MIPTFFLVYFFLTFWWRKKELGNRRKVWMVVSVFSITVSVLFSILSVWSVHNPYATYTNWTVKWGENDGVFPISKSSFPLYITVYHDFNTGPVGAGRVIFKIFLMGIEIGEISGTFTYAPIFRETLLNYSSLNFPIFNNVESFLYLLIFLFTFFNLFGAFLGTVLAYKIEKHRTTFSRT